MEGAPWAICGPIGATYRLNVKFPGISGGRPDELCRENGAFPRKHEEGSRSEKRGNFLVFPGKSEISRGEAGSRVFYSIFDFFSNQLLLDVLPVGGVVYGSICTQQVQSCLKNDRGSLLCCADNVSTITLFMSDMKYLHQVLSYLDNVRKKNAAEFSERPPVMQCVSASMK